MISGGGLICVKDMLKNVIAIACTKDRIERSGKAKRGIVERRTDISQQIEEQESENVH